MDIELKKWNGKDRSELIKICNAVDRTYLSNRLPYPYTEKDAEWWLNIVEATEGINGVFRAVTVDGQIIGNISIEQKEDVYCKDAEIGYMLNTDRWSQGIMTEAVKEICKIAFSELDILRVTGLVYGANTASRKVLEKNGFSLEGTMKNAIIKNEKIYDLCIYGKLKEET